MFAWLITGKVRDIARAIGLTKLLELPKKRRYDARRKTYNDNPCDEAAVEVLGVSITGLVGNLGEYIRVKSLEDDSELIGGLMRHGGPGKIAWDIGSNIGLYACMMAKSGGSDMKVIAFEPEPRAAARIKDNAARNDLENIEVLEIALGAEPGTASLAQEGDFSAGTHSLSSAKLDETAVHIDVEVNTGDRVVANGTAECPDIVKIDVEGFEEEVVDGMAETLANPKCAAILIEVHFAILKRNGKEGAANRILDKLTAAGLKNHNWIDASHILATR